MKRNTERLTLVFLAGFLATDVASGAPRLPEHPRLLVGKEDISSLQAKAADTSKTAMGVSPRELFLSLKQDADVLLKRSSRLPSKDPRDKDRFKDVAIAFERGVINLSFLYVLTGEGKYLDAAREALLRLSGWNRWSWWDPADRTGTLDMGAITTGFAVSYDMLYPALNARDREWIRKALVTKGLVPLYEGAARANKWPFNTAEDNNWFIAGIGPLGLGALSVLGEESAAETWLDKATAEAKRFLSLTSESSGGGYAEGVTYGNYAVMNLVRFGDALARVRKIELDQEWLRAYPYFLLYTILPGGREHLNFNDETGAGFGDAEIMARATTRYRDDPVSGYAQWYLKSFGRGPGAGWTNPFVFLQFDPKIEPRTPEELPRYRYFQRIGWIIYRTGWNEDDVFFAFKAQSSDADAAEHLHYDGGHFVLYNDGWLLTDPGYQKGAPWGKSAGKGKRALNFFTRGSYGHNTVIVDGFSQSAFASKLSSVFANDQLLGIQADLADNYYAYSQQGGKMTRGPRLLDRFVREVLLLLPDYLIVVDRIRTSGGPRKVESLFHAGSWDFDSKRVIHPKIAIDGHDFRLARGDSSTELAARVILPADAAVEAVLYEGIEEIGKYVAVSLGRKVQEVEFVVLLFPAGARLKEPKITELTTAGLVGIEIETGDAKDTVVFQEGSGAVEFGALKTDGATTVVRRGINGSVELASMQGGTFVAWRDRTLFRSDRRASVISNGKTALVETEESAEAGIFSRSTGGLLQHSLKKGRNEIEIDRGRGVK